MNMDTDALRDPLKHIYWIGGGSGGGKSTIARRLAAELGMQLYQTDEAMAEHVRRSTPQNCPLLHRFMAMDMDERWVDRTPQEMLETFHWFRGEAFNMIVDDLLAMPKEPAVIVEGFRLLPELVQPLLADTTRAIWLLPSPNFRHAVFENRGGEAWSFVGRTSKPGVALRNLLERDALFTEALRTEVARLGLNAIEVDQSMTEDELIGLVSSAFRF